MALPLKWFLAAASVAIAAFYYQYLLTKKAHAVYVIGDLHGDVYCAYHWVKKTGLIIENDDNSMIWTDPTSRIVFLGDYIDKGPTSRQTLELVKSLTDQFPEHVTALMGNHEMELLLDRDPTRTAWGKGRGYFQLPFAAAHPGEYLNYIDSISQEDELVVEALYNASLEVYGHSQYSSVYLAPDEDAFLKHLRPELRRLVEGRLLMYQKRYLDAFRSGTELGTWLEQRPIAAIENEGLFVHGGISGEAARHLSIVGVDRINQVMAEHASEDKLRKFIEETREGRVIYDLLVHRGNHNPDSCDYLSKMLPRGATRLGVGHTPGSSVRIQCNGAFLALDSSLGRYFRNSGNEYCRGDKEQRSLNGRFRCRKMNQECQGQIIRIQNGAVEVIEAYRSN